MLRQLDFLRRTLLAAGFSALTGCATSTAVRSVPAAAPTPKPEMPAVAQNVLLIRADSAWKAQSYVVAEALYSVAVARDSSNSVAVFRLATLRSWDNELEDGVRLYRHYIALEPRDVEGRLSLARAIAWSGQYASAIATYDSVLADNPSSRDAVLGRAQTLAWSGQLDEALDTYKRWLNAHPTDRDASLDYARALSWSGDLGQAERMYADLARTGDPNAQKGLARVIAWRGDLEKSERAWQQVLDIRPNDPEALTGLAQTLRWQGRQSDAESALELALQSNPAYGDARALQRWVQADLRPNVTVTGLGSDDSDENRVTNLMVDYVNSARWNTTFGGRYTQRRASFAAVDSRVDGANLFGAWQRASWQFRAEGGASRHSSTIGVSALNSQTLASAGVRASGVLGRILRLGIGASRSPFDETALLIANGVVSAEYSGDAELSLPQRFSLSAGGSHARLTGGSRDNERNAFSSTLRWKYNRNWSVAVGGREFGYDTTSTDGYFAPRRYVLAEASTRGHLGGELGWNSDADVGLGQQSIDFFGSTSEARLADRAAVSVGYRFDPRQEMTLSGSYANVAAPGQTGGSEYRFYSVSLRMRLGF